MSAKAKPVRHAQQAVDFVTALHREDWRTVTVWIDGGNAFEMLAKGAKRILVQVYPDAHGFEIWRPVTESNKIDDTAAAVAQYAEGQ